MSECACVYVDDYGDHADQTEKSTIVARVPVQCTECRRMIEPNESYEYVWGIWEGGPDVMRTCNDCLSVRNSFFCDGWVYCGLWDDLAAHIDGVGGHVESACIIPLTPRARDRVFELIEWAWEQTDDIEADDD